MPEIRWSCCCPDCFLFKGDEGLAARMSGAVNVSGPRGCWGFPGPAVNPSMGAWVRHPCLTQSRKAPTASRASHRISFKHFCFCFYSRVLRRSVMRGLNACQGWPGPCATGMSHPSLQGRIHGVSREALTARMGVSKASSIPTVPREQPADTANVRYPRYTPRLIFQPFPGHLACRTHRRLIPAPSRA